jgi:hypothetical protein
MIGANDEPGMLAARPSIPGHRMFDLHHIGAPVGEHGTRRRNERELGDL